MRLTVPQITYKLTIAGRSEVASVSLSDLEHTRERLIEQINADLTGDEKEFLLSMKRLAPKWELLGLPGVDHLPGPQWKLYNLRKMDPAKRRAAEERLRQTLRQ